MAAWRTAVLLQDRDRARENGLLDPGELLANLGVEFGWTGGLGPVAHDSPCPLKLSRGATDRDNLDGSASSPKRVPEPAVRRTPGVKRGRGRVAGIGVDEDGTLGVQRDGQLYREVAPSRTGGTPVNPDGQQPVFDAEGLERGDFLGFGGQPRQAGMLDHVVEREQAPHEYGGRGVAAVADVLGSDGPVDPPGEDAAHAADPPDAGHGLLGGQTLRDQRVDDAPHLFRVCIEES